MNVKKSWDITDDNIGFSNKFSNLLLIGNISISISAPIRIIVFCNFLGIFYNVARDVNTILDKRLITSGLLNK